MPSLTGCTIQVLAPQDTPNQGRTKINENFNCFLQVAFSGAAVNQFLSLVSGGLVSGNTDFVSGAQLLSGGTDLYNIFLTRDGILRVQPGVNVYTGGTALLPSINVTGLSIDNITVSGNSRFISLSGTSLSGGTLYSGTSELYSILSPLFVAAGAGDKTRVQLGINTFTAGTDNFPSVSVTGISIDNITVSGDARFISLSGTSLSGGTLYSGTSELYSVLSPLFVAAGGGDVSRVQPGTNTFTAGTANFSSVNITGASLDNITVSGDSRFISLSGTSLSGATLYSGTSELYSVLSPLFVAAGDDDVSRVQHGTNTFTAGTANFPSVNVTGVSLDNITVSGDVRFISLSGTSLSGGTLYSGTSELYSVLAPFFEGGGDTTRVQPGTNTFTAGTANFPSINITAATLDSLSVTAGTSANTITASTDISAHTIYNSNLLQHTSTGLTLNLGLAIDNPILDATGFGLGVGVLPNLIHTFPIGVPGVFSSNTIFSGYGSVILASSDSEIEVGAFNAIIASQAVVDPLLGGSPSAKSHITGSSWDSSTLNVLMGTNNSEINNSSLCVVASSNSGVTTGATSSIIGASFIAEIKNSEFSTMEGSAFSFMHGAVNGNMQGSFGSTIDGVNRATIIGSQGAEIRSATTVSSDNQSTLGIYSSINSNITGGSATVIIGSTITEINAGQGNSIISTTQSRITGGTTATLGGVNYSSIFASQTCQIAQSPLSLPFSGTLVHAAIIGSGGSTISGASDTSSIISSINSNIVHSSKSIILGSNTAKIIMPYYTGGSVTDGVGIICSRNTATFSGDVGVSAMIAVDDCIIYGTGTTSPTQSLTCFIFGGTKNFVSGTNRNSGIIGGKTNLIENQDVGSDKTNLIIGSDVTTIRLSSGLAAAIMCNDTLLTNGSNTIAIGTQSFSGVGVVNRTIVDTIHAEKAWEHHNNNIVVAGVPSSSSWGEIVYVGSGTSMQIGSLYYLNSANTWEAASATGSTVGEDRLLGFPRGTDLPVPFSSQTAHSSGMLIEGYIGLSTLNIVGTPIPGSAVYLAGNGAVSVDKPSVSGNIVRVVGYVLATGATTTQIRFKPDSTYITIA